MYGDKNHSSVVKIFKTMDTKQKISRRKFLKYCAIGGTGVLAASYPFFIERFLVMVNTYRIPVSNLPSAFEGFTILQLTDLHYGYLMPETVIRQVIRKANKLNKDLIVCTGDYVSGVDQIDKAWEMLSELRAPYGVYSVLGNHDHWGDFDRSMYWMEQTGQDLRHKSVPINKDNQRLWLGGAGDLYEDEIGIDKAFAGVPPQECKVALAHNPDSADTEFSTRVDLMISGHTHGGQVKLPFIGTPILPVNNPLYASGLIKTPKTSLYISRGIGCAILPIRFNCPPEISILQLTRQE